MSFVRQCLLDYHLIDLNDENEKSYHHISFTQSTQDCAVRSAPHIRRLSVKTAGLSNNSRGKTAHLSFSCGHLGIFRTEFCMAKYLASTGLFFHTQFSSTLLVRNKCVPNSHLPHLPSRGVVNANPHLKSAQRNRVGR